MKNESEVKMMTEVVPLRPKAYSYLKYDRTEHKTAKGTKKCVIERESKFKNYENFNKPNHFDNIIKYLEKNEINTDSLKKGYEEFIKNNELILKKQGESKREGHNVYTEIINKIALSPNDEYNRLMQ